MEDSHIIVHNYFAQLLVAPGWCEWLLVAADDLVVVLLHLVALAALVVALLFLVLAVVALVVAGLGLATVLRRLRRAAISIFFHYNQFITCK